MDLGEILSLGVKLASAPARASDSEMREPREERTSRRQEGGIARHGDGANRGQKNWRYALIDQGGGHTALRINDGGPHCKQWNLERGENNAYAAHRISDLPGEWNKSESLRHPEDEGVHAEGTLQAHRADADHIYATMQDGRGNGTFELRRQEGDGDRWTLRFGPRPKGVNDFAGEFVRALQHKTASDTLVERGLDGVSNLSMVGSIAGAAGRSSLLDRVAPSLAKPLGALGQTARLGPWATLATNAYQTGDLALHPTQAMDGAVQSMQAGAERGEKLLGSAGQWAGAGIGAAMNLPASTAAGARGFAQVARAGIDGLARQTASGQGMLPGLQENAASRLGETLAAGHTPAPSPANGLPLPNRPLLQPRSGAHSPAALRGMANAPAIPSPSPAPLPAGWPNVRPLPAMPAVPAAAPLPVGWPNVRPLPATPAIPAPGVPKQGADGFAGDFVGTLEKTASHQERLTKLAARLGLWANIRKKRQRGGEPAKPGEAGYPDKKNWRRLTTEKRAGDQDGVVAAHLNKESAFFHDPRVGQRAEGQPPRLDLAFFANRSTPQVLRPDLGDEPGPKAGYGEVTLQRRANPAEVAQLNAGKWLRVDEEGRTPRDPDYRITQYRAGLARLRQQALETRGDRELQADQKTASAFVRDVELDSLPADVKKDVARFVEGPLKGLRVPQYGMVVKELIPEADPVNLATARAHVREDSVRSLERRVQQQIRRGEKFVLICNRRVIDGHHFIARAERAGCTASLPVLDLTGCRHQRDKKAELAGLDLGRLFIKSAGLIQSVGRGINRWVDHPVTGPTLLGASLGLGGILGDTYGEAKQIHLNQTEIANLANRKDEQAANFRKQIAENDEDWANLARQSTQRADDLNYQVQKLEAEKALRTQSGHPPDRPIAPSGPTAAQRDLELRVHSLTNDNENLQNDVRNADRSRADLNHSIHNRNLVIGGGAIALAGGGLAMYLHHLRSKRKNLPKNETNLPSTDKTAGAGNGKLSCLMAPVPRTNSLHDDLIAFARSIPQDDLYVGEDGKTEGGKYGREDSPHVTCLYGLVDGDPEPIRKFVQDKAPFHLVLDGLSSFDASDKDPYDVLKFDVKAPELEELHAALKEKFDCEISHPNFHPHLTVCYTKPGRAAKFLGRDKLVGASYTAAELTFSDAAQQKTPIKLEGKSKTASPLDSATFPLTGPLGTSTLAAAGIGAGAMGLLHAYRAGKRKLLHEPADPEADSFLGDVGRGALLGGAANVAFKGLGGMMGGAQPVNDHPVPYENPIVHSPVGDELPNFRTKMSAPEVPAISPAPTGMLSATLPSATPGYVSRVQNNPVTTVKPIEPLQATYGAQLPGILSQARSYQAAHPETNFVNRLDDSTLHRPVPIAGSQSMLKFPGFEGALGLTAGGKVDQNWFQKLIGAKPAGPSINVVSNSAINPDIRGTIDHEILHSTQNLDHELPLMARPAESTAENNYYMIPHEVEARLPRLNRMWTQEGNPFPTSPEQADQVLQHYGFLPPGMSIPGNSTGAGTAESPSVSDPQRNQFFQRVDRLPQDIKDLRGSYESLPPDQKVQFYNRIRQIQPGVVQNTPAPVAKVARPLAGFGLGAFF